VPAHTIAWLYDSAANETIVYVNPTDQTLSVGDSSLAEIHLQGIATIDASDFIIDPPTATVALAGAQADLAMAATLQADGTTATTAADISSASTAPDGTLLADASWAEQTTNLSHAFSAERDQTDLVDNARSISSDDVQLHSTEDVDYDAAIALADGKPIEAHHVHAMAPTETHFVFDKLPTFDSPANGNAIGPGGIIHDTIIAAIAELDAAEPLPVKHAAMAKGDDGGALSHGNKAIDSVPAPIIASDKEDHGTSKNADNHGQASDAGPHVADSPGLLKAAESSGGNHSISDGDSKHGSPPGHDAGVQNSGPTSTADIPPGSETGPPDSFHFKSSTTGGPDVIEHGKSDHTPASITYQEDPPALGGNETLAIELQEQYLADAPTMHGGHVSHVQHDLVV